MKKRLFPLLIALSALAVSGSAAFYSVFGLSKLFAGASTQVIIMAGSLEFAKLVVASLLYQYWDTINKFLRTYFMIACFILMVITSGGIYGFLSGAYQSTATQSELLDKSLMILNQKQIRFEETKEDLTIEKTQITKSISDLRISLSSPTSVSYWDENSQTVITTTSSSTRRALQAELKTTIADRDNLNLKLEAVLDSIGKTDLALLDKEISNEAESELGPLKYLAETTGKPMNEVVNWFLLLIVFVFDPLAIALVVAANMAFAHIRKPEDIVIGEYVDTDGQPIKEITVDGGEIEVTIEPTKKQMEDEDYFSDLQDYIKAVAEEPLDNLTYPKTPLNIPTHDPQTGELNPYYKELTDEENPLQEEETNKRMDIIGKNGNDGLHYDEEEIDDTIEEDLSRLTDTTQTLIVKEEVKDDLTIDDDEYVWNELGQRVTNKKKNILRYTKRGDTPII